MTNSSPLSGPPIEAMTTIVAQIKLAKVTQAFPVPAWPQTLRRRSLSTLVRAERPLASHVHLSYLAVGRTRLLPCRLSVHYPTRALASMLARWLQLRRCSSPASQIHLLEGRSGSMGSMQTEGRVGGEGRVRGRKATYWTCVAYRSPSGGKANFSCFPSSLVVCFQNEGHCDVCAPWSLVCSY